MGTSIGLFSPKTFEEGKHSVVGTINNLSCEERWRHETPVFTDAIVRLLSPNCSKMLDYGCGIGRMSKEVLSRSPAYSVVGVDNSSVQLEHARSYVSDPRFIAVFPHQLEGEFDLAFSLYVLQHVSAIDLRQTIEIIHANLRPDGLFVQCCSERRMALRKDAPLFFDDRLLRVDVTKEIERLFEPVADLFTHEDLEKNPIVKRMVLGLDDRDEPDDNGKWGDAHPAKVYRRRSLSVPYWKVPLP